MTRLRRFSALAAGPGVRAPPPPPAAYASLFEPLRIGPVIAPNRFWQVPHCNGMGHGRPRALAAMRGVKAEGGWGVVCTEEVEIHPTSDVSPDLEGRLWDDADLAGLRLMTDAVHAHGALAGIELTHAGYHARNNYSRLVPIAPSACSARGLEPQQARAMTRADIAEARRWFVAAARRAKAAGFDVVYVYAAHGLPLLQHFLSAGLNQRTDEYGGSLENRCRLLREVLSDTRDAVGDRCAIALRFAVDGDEARDVVAALAEIPDVWDVNVGDWAADSATARFEPTEGFQEKQTAFVKTLTSKPVVGVGRYTSPDAMVSALRRGVLDFIGAARPSIADPFLPAKIRAGAADDIRECVGCNMCVTGDMLASPIRCTQNPTMGEEWRRGWHPERAGPAAPPGAPPVLVVGGGPAGLEAASTLVARGYEVTLADAARELGGRSLREAALPGLASYRRVAAHRLRRLRLSPRATLAPGGAVTAQDVLSAGFPRVLVATGARWRADGVGRSRRSPLPGLGAPGSPRAFGPEDLLDGGGPGALERVVLFDDDHYMMGSVLAEVLLGRGADVTLVTPAAVVASWASLTLEQAAVHARLLRLGAKIAPHTKLVRADAGSVALECVVTGREWSVAADALVLVTEREAEDGLVVQLSESPAALAAAGIESVRAIGDCFAPGTIAAAVYSGHLAAREMDGGSPPPLREKLSLG